MFESQRKKVVAGGILFLFVTGSLLPQTVSDSLKILVEEMVQKEVADQLLWPKRLGLISAVLVAVYGIYMFFIGIKKKAEEVINEQLSSAIDREIGEQVGVKSELLKRYFKRIESEENLLDSRVLILNRNGLKDIRLVQNIKDGYFSKPPVFKAIADTQENLDQNEYDLVVFDNRDSGMNEKEMMIFIDNKPLAFAYVCLTTNDWSNENYQKYSRSENSLKFVKDANYLTDVMKNALK